MCNRTVNKNRKCEKEINSRVGLKATALCALDKVWRSTSLKKKNTNKSKYV